MSDDTDDTGDTPHATEAPGTTAPPAEVASFIEAASRYVARAIGAELDGSETSLAFVDHYIEATAPAGAPLADEVLALVAPALGCYFGQLVLDRYGGRWALETAIRAPGGMIWRPPSCASTRWAWPPPRFFTTMRPATTRASPPSSAGPSRSPRALLLGPRQSGLLLLAHRAPRGRRAGGRDPARVRAPVARAQELNHRSHLDGKAV